MKKVPADEIALGKNIYPTFEVPSRLYAQYNLKILFIIELCLSLSRIIFYELYYYYNTMHMLDNDDEIQFLVIMQCCKEDHKR